VEVNEVDLASNFTMASQKTLDALPSMVSTRYAIQHHIFFSP